MGSSREETFTPSEVVVIIPPVGDVHPVQTDTELLAVSPLPTDEGLLQDLLWAPVAPRPPGISEREDQCSSTKVPRWRLAREGPFLAERSTAVLSSFGAGCAFRCTSYRASDFGISLESSAISGVDWRARVGQSAGDGTWKVD